MRQRFCGSCYQKQRQLKFNSTFNERAFVGRDSGFRGEEAFGLNSWGFEALVSGSRGEDLSFVGIRAERFRAFRGKDLGQGGGLRVLVVSHG